MTHSTRQAIPDAGLSLLETLVGLTLIGLVGATAANGVRFGLTAWERSAAIAERSVETRVIEKFVADLLAQAKRVHIRDGSRFPPALFDGTSDRLSFIGALPAHLAEPGDYLISLAIEDHDSTALTMRWRAVGDAPPQIGAKAPREVLIDGLAGGGFAYFGAAPARGDAMAEGPIAWRNEWVGRESLPDLIEVRWRRSGLATRSDRRIVARTATAAD